MTRAELLDWFRRLEETPPGQRDMVPLATAIRELTDGDLSAAVLAYLDETLPMSAAIDRGIICEALKRMLTRKP